MITETSLTDKKRMVSLAIGVSEADNLPFLPAAPNCADRFYKWSVAVGYEAAIITDADQNPVTVERLQAELNKILADTRPIHRILIYFAGHGIIREVASGLWLLSDWKRKGVVVAHESLRQRLASFGINQIAIFSDACRSLPKSMSQLQLDETSVLAPGPVEDAEPDVDKFFATRDGKKAFALPGSVETADVCVFSGVLLEALWGKRAEAFSKYVSNSITSSSLALHLKAEVPRIAKEYGLSLKPSVSAAFPEGDNVYLPPGILTVESFPPFDWPALCVAPPSGLQTSLTASVPPIESTALPMTLPFGLQSSVGESQTAESPARSISNEKMDGAPTVHETRDDRTGSTRVVPTRKRPRPLLERLRNQKLPTGFETWSGFAVEGAEVRRLWTPNRVFARPHLDANWWRVWESADSSLSDPKPILIEFTNGQFAALAALPDFVAGLVCDSRGVSAVVYRLTNSNAGARFTEDVIGKLERGVLGADEVTDLAAQIRVQKHLDPMLGVFAAYLYHSIGDIGSIRRMAYFYTHNRQPIPYDIAILAQVRSRPWGDGFVAHVPRVAERRPRSDAEKQHRWTHQETPACDGVIGGAWPWLRQGWAFLAEPKDRESTLMRSGLAELTKELTRSRFPTFGTDGGLELARLFALVPRDPLIPFNPELDLVIR